MFESLTTPIEIVRETDKAYAVNNPAYAEARELFDWGGAFEIMRRGSQEAREAWQNNAAYVWLPKSQVQAEGNVIVAVAGWLAKKNGYETAQQEQAQQARFDRYDLFVKQAKAAGVAGIRSRMKVASILAKAAEQGIELQYA
jgi:hypothetical protein